MYSECPKNGHFNAETIRKQVKLMSGFQMAVAAIFLTIWFSNGYHKPKGFKNIFLNKIV
jgi:hypothetical protein